jgi:hypothetical protein
MSLKEKDLEAERNEHVHSSPISNITSSKLIIDQTSLSSKPPSTALDVQDIINQNPSPEPEHDDAETRRIIRKIDLRLLPTLAVIYAFALIDRVNLPNVRSSPY